jgi:adenosylcobinamide hydrolase
MEGEPKASGMLIWARPQQVEVPAEHGAAGQLLVWKFSHQLRSISSSVVGGGIGLVDWVMNLTVDSDYSRYDPGAHIAQIAAGQNLAGSGIGLMTAVNVFTHTVCQSDGASVCSTVGVSRPVWARDPSEPLPKRDTRELRMPGTINLVCFVSEPLSDAALVNAIATITEAKTQALADCGIVGTGTASDAACVVCPVGTAENQDPFGGPRSYWGARLASATYEAVSTGVKKQQA